SPGAQVAPWVVMFAAWQEAEFIVPAAMLVRDREWVPPCAWTVELARAALPMFAQFPVVPSSKSDDSTGGTAAVGVAEITRVAAPRVRLGRSDPADSGRV